MHSPDEGPTPSTGIAKVIDIRRRQMEVQKLIAAKMAIERTTRKRNIKDDGAGSSSQSMCTSSSTISDDVHDDEDSHTDDDSSGCNGTAVQMVSDATSSSCTVPSIRDERHDEMLAAATNIPMPLKRSWPVGTRYSSNYTRTEKFDATWIQYESTVRRRYKLEGRRTSQVKLTDIVPIANLAPSVTVNDILSEPKTLRQLMSQMNLIPKNSDGKEIFTVGHRFVNGRELGHIVDVRRTAVIKAMKPAVKDAGTQTMVTQVGVALAEGCSNCRSGKHTFKTCLLPLRAGICERCGAEEYSNPNYCLCSLKAAADEHCCPECFVDNELYTPDCATCNCTYGMNVDWYKINYIRWPWNFVTQKVFELSHSMNVVTGKDNKCHLAMKTIMRNKFSDISYLLRDSAVSDDGLMLAYNLPTKREIAVERRELREARYDGTKLDELTSAVSTAKPELEDSGEKVTIAIPVVLESSLNIG